MSGSTPAPALPLVRECRPGGLRPLLAPGGRDTYFSPDVQRMLFAADEPIARFLPPAKYAMPERQERAQDGRAAQVSYTVPDEILKTATPLTTLARAEIDAFANAATVFLAKAQPDAKGVPPYIRQCRQEFRLPNPDLDPSAYWVYGSEFDRRLLILWGCEPPAGSSLPLDKVVEKLRAREMAWRDRQELGLKLALRPDEPLARFLAPRVADGGLVIRGATVSPKRLRRLKTIAPTEWRAFDTAAKAYYVKAHPNAPGATPFEQEVRREFQLPSLAKVPGDFYLHGSRLVIALDTWPREATLPLTEDETLKIPAPAAAQTSVAAVAAPTGATVSAELKARQQPPWVIYAKLGAAAAGLVLLGAVAWLLRPDTTPPQFKSIDATDRKIVTITFDEPLDPASIQPKPAGAGQAPADPIVFLDGKLDIESRNLRSNDPRVIVVHTKTELKDGEKYGVAIKNIADASRRHNAIVPLSKEVAFFDQVPPVLKTISAGGPSKRHLVLVFSKPISDDSLARARFTVWPVDGGERGKPIRVDATLDANDKSGATLLLKADDDFTDQKPYVLDATGLKDRTTRGNPVEEKSVTNRAFDYVNTLAPRLNDMVATGGKFEIRLMFASPLDPASSGNAASYALTTADAKPLRIASVDVPAPFTDVVLHLAPTKLTDGPHQLRIEKLTGKNRVALEAPIERTFSFNDRPKPPAVEKVELPANSSRLKLAFDRIVATDTAGVVGNYRILDRDAHGTDIGVRSAEPASDDPTRIVLVLSRVPKGGKYYVETSGLADVFGAKQELPARYPFEVKGGGDIVQSLIGWAAPPALREGGRVVVLSIRGRLRDVEARSADNYDLDPAPATPPKVENVQLGAADERLTTVTLRFAEPIKPPLTIAAHGLVLDAAPGRGGQSLPAQNVQ
jgi:hypothetical protein